MVAINDRTDLWGFSLETHMGNRGESETQYDSSPRDPKQGERGKSINLIKIDQFFDFSPTWSWEPLDRLKILS